MDGAAEKKNKKGYIRVVLLAVVIVLSGRAVAGVKDNTIETALAEYGSISILEKASGIVVRNETVINSPISGYVTYIIKENIRVPVNTKVLEMKSGRIDDSSIERYNEINERLQALDQIGSLAQAALDDSVIRAGLYNISILIDQGNLAAVYREKERLSREISYNTAANTTQAEREELISEKEELESIIEGGIRAEFSPFSGIPVHTMDGYEGMFCPENMHEIIPSMVQPENIRKADLSKEIKAGEPVLKIVDNHEWYIVCDMSGEFAEGIKQGSRVSLELLGPENITVGARVKGLHEQEEGFRVVFASGDYFPGVYEKRTVDLNVVKEKHSGCMIPVEALIEKDGEYQVQVLEAEKIVNKRVRVKGNDGVNAVVESTGTGPELKIYDMIVIRR